MIVGCRSSPCRYFCFFSCIQSITGCPCFFSSKHVVSIAYLAGAFNGCSFPFTLSCVFQKTWKMVPILGDQFAISPALLAKSIGLPTPLQPSNTLGIFFALMEYPETEWNRDNTNNQQQDKIVGLTCNGGIVEHCRTNGSERICCRRDF